jgi:hypothetical protein
MIDLNFQTLLDLMINYLYANLTYIRRFIVMRKLGKHPKRIDKRTFKLSRYMPVLPPIPTVAGWDQGQTAWGEMMNDRLGICTIACAGHFEMLWTMNASNLFTPLDSQIVAAYSAITGYDPSKTLPDGSNPTDQGADEITVLNAWRNNGIAGHKINAYAEIPVVGDPVSILNNIRASIHLFGGCYLGVMLPDNWETQINSNLPWTLVKGFGPNQNNGHAIPLVSYDQNFFYCITWGQIQPISTQWFLACCDEAYAVISSDFFFNSFAPNCFDMDTLTNDLKLL